MPNQYIQVPGNPAPNPTIPNTVSGYNPGLSNGPATTGTNIASWTRLGAYMFIQGVLVSSSAGPASRVTMSLPPGYTADNSILPGTTGTCYGSCRFFQSGVGVWSGATNYVNSTTFDFVTGQNTSNSLLGDALTTNSVLAWNAMVPITGWNQ